MLEEGCFADPAFPDHGGALVGAGAEAVDDLADILAAAVKAGRVADGIAEGEGVDGHKLTLSR